jgi:hypothetical protein
MNFSSDERHGATLEILNEALDLLLRMPHAPVTRRLCQKIMAHLAEPTQVLVDQVTRQGVALEGGDCTPAGIPLLHARLEPPSNLLIWAPKPESNSAFEKARDRILRRVYGEGVRIRLRHSSELAGPSREPTVLGGAASSP